MTHLLYQISASDPVIFAGAAVVLLAVMLLACYIPARPGAPRASTRWSR
jgi:hypothetical protein